MSANVVGEPIALTDPRDGSLRVVRNDDQGRLLIVIEAGSLRTSIALGPAAWRSLVQDLANPPPLQFVAAVRVCAKCGTTAPRQGWAYANVCGACACRPFRDRTS